MFKILYLSISVQNLLCICPFVYVQDFVSVYLCLEPVQDPAGEHARVLLRPGHEQDARPGGDEVGL